MTIETRSSSEYLHITLAGKEGDVEEAAAAAMRTIEMINRTSANP